MPVEILTQNAPTQQQKEKLIFKHLPGYARFIRENCLIPYIKETLRISHEVNLPMLKFFEGVTDDELMTMGLESNKDFFTSAENNTLRELLDRSLKRWVEDGLGIIKREEISAEDITLASYIRKSALAKFLPSYTTDVHEAIEIIKEIDIYAIESDTAATNVVISIQKDKRLQLIDQLLQSEQLYKQAQTISHTGNWTWDFETKELNWSDEIYHIYEIEPQSVHVSTDIAGYNHPEDQEIVNESIKNVVETHQPFNFDHRIILKDGRIKTLHAKGEVDTTKKGSLIIHGTLQDITEQKLVERQLKDYKDFIEKITDVTPSIIAAYNINTGKYSFINEAIEKLLGYPTTRIMEEGVTFFTSIVHPDDLPGILEKNTKALEDANQLEKNDDEPVVEFKYRMQHKDGEYRWFHTFGTIFERNEKGLVESILNVSVDVTDQEVAEQALFQRNLKLQQSNTSLEEYAYVASHDLKEPLRKIATYSDRIIMTQSATLNDDGKNYLNKIIDSSRRMQKMINDLLSVSTILGNKAIEPCDLNLALGEAIYSLDHKIEENKAIIESDNLPVISVVPAQFRQLFQNLISNSLKFTREGVQPFIKITHTFLNYKAVESYRLTKAKRYLQIKLEDNGIGFDNQYADKIFAIFQRLHGKSEYDGTGIGLAVCKKIIENHDGIIIAKGAVDQGAVFTMIIPI